MKIALCFSGAIRDFDTCISSIKRYLMQNYDIDVFLHLWEFTDLSNISYDFKWRPDTVNTQRVIDLLKPKKYSIDKFDKNWEDKIIKEANIDTTKFVNQDDKNYGFNCCSMYYKILKCFELMEEYSEENNINYDIIIRARLDFIWEEKISFDNLDKNKLYLLKDRYATHSKLITNDKFFFGSYPIMKKMCNIFEYLKEYQDNGIRLEGQGINEHHIKSYKFNIGWVGNENTNYKCMGRHKIGIRTKKILVDNIHENQEIINEITYILLFFGYKVYYKNNINNHYINCFPNFYNYDKNLKYDDNISYNSGNDNDKNYFILKLNKSILKVNKNILGNLKDNLGNFILALLMNKVEDRTYVFDKEELITEINNDEMICYKYSDKGYYYIKIISKNNDYYLVNFENKNKNIKRSEFTIRNIYNYYKDGILPY